MKLELRRSDIHDKTVYYISNETSERDINNLEDIGRLVDACRLNALSMVYYAGSGHIGTSFSVAEILGLLKFSSVNMFTGLPHLKNSMSFSSKGHDAPILYALMHASGELKDKDLFKLRRFGGLPGHPTIEHAGVIANTGSLGMGISKAKGLIYSNRKVKRDLRVNVILGDGELQEGQIWESLAGASRDRLTELTAVVDANGIQSDSWVSSTLSLGDVKTRVEAMEWNYLECDGNSLSELVEVLSEKNLMKGPNWIQASTIKGKGVSFMEEFPKDGKYYKYHSGAPNEEEYTQAILELVNLIKPSGSNLVNGKATREKLRVEHFNPKIRQNSIIDLYADVLFEVVKSDNNILVMDADLNYDTGTYKVKELVNEQYLQCGIAEQDMVSIAGGMALNNIRPIVHSFGTFLTMRAYEQIFNNATEKSIVTYVGFLAGVLPGPPGVSHQAVTDFPIMSVLPNMRLFEPATAREITASLNRAVNGSSPSYIRMQSVGVPQEEGEQFQRFTLWGSNASENLILCSGLTMLNQALGALKLLESKGHTCRLASIFDFQFDDDTELIELLFRSKNVLVIENSLPGNLLYSRVSTLISNNSNLDLKIKRHGLLNYPFCGQNDEVLREHKLDASGIFEAITALIE